MSIAKAPVFGFDRFSLFEAGWLNDDTDGRADEEASCCIGRVRPTGMAFEEVRGGALAETDTGSEGRGLEFCGSGGPFAAAGKTPVSR